MSLRIKRGCGRRALFSGMSCFHVPSWRLVGSAKVYRESPSMLVLRGPETLVLYRMRPTVSAHVSPEVGRGASDTAV